MRREMTEEEARIVAAGRDVARVLAKSAAACESERRPPREAWDAYLRAGLKGMLVPRDKGGYDLSASAMAQISEAMGTTDPAAALTVVPQEYCMAAVARYRHHPWHDEVLGALIAGKRLAGFLLTEPQSGSDASALRTMASRRDGGWRIDGAKAWVTNAPYTDEHFVFAQTAADAGAKGIAGFLIPREASGITISKPYDLLGGHTASICDVQFTNVEIGDERLVVPPGEGLRAALAAIDLARINVAAMCCGMLQTGIETALAHAKSRRAFGQRLVDFQGLQWGLAEVATDLHASRLLTYDAAEQLERDGKASVPAAHAKKFASRAALNGLRQCMQTMGANGLRHDWPLARLFANAKMAEYLDGTTEIQNVVIGRSMLSGNA